MKNFSSLVLALILSLSVLMPGKTQAAVEVPVKAKAFLTVSAYGAAGGALLGAASMAFGGNTRSIAQGASLGLYAGILFGTYVLISHHNKRLGDYDDKASPYKDENGVYGDDYNNEEGGSSDGESGSGSFFNRLDTVQQKFGQKKGSNLPPFKVNFFNYQF
jgi:hypothetical protein